MGAELHPGQELYSVATGRLDPFRKASRVAVEYMSDLQGFVGVTAEPEHGQLIWLFDTENNAKMGRNLAEAKGIQCGTNICRFVVAADGVPEFDDDWARAHGLKED